MANETWVDETVNVFSNALSADGSINTPSEFNVALPHPVDLRGMQVAVRNITFPTSWDPTPRKNRTKAAPRWAVVSGLDGTATSFKQWDKAQLGGHPNLQTTEWMGSEHKIILFTLENHPYKTIDDVVRQMFKQIYQVFPQAFFPKLRFHTDNSLFLNHRRVTLKNSQAAYTLWANPTLAKLLRFGQDPNDPLPVKFIVTDGVKRGTLQTVQDIPVQSARLETPFMCLARGMIDSKDSATINKVSEKNAIDLDASAVVVLDGVTQISRFLVYTDFIQDRIVGGIRTGLLLSVPNPGLQVRLNAASYSHDIPLPLSLPTENTNLKSLKFVVRDDNGDIIDFSWGVTSLELHFTRRTMKRSWNENL